ADATEIADIARRIGARRATALCTDTVQEATKALDADDLDRARYWVESADRLDECAERTAKPKEKLAREVARREARDEAARWPADDPLRPAPEEREDYEALVSATALGDADRMMAAAQRFRQRHPDSDLEPSATLVTALARDLAGHRDEARATLEHLA